MEIDDPCRKYLFIMYPNRTLNFRAFKDDIWKIDLNIKTSPLKNWRYLSEKIANFRDQE